MTISEFLRSGEVLEFLGSVITIGIGLWFGQILINWWENKR